MRKNRFISCVLTASMLLSCAAAPAASANQDAAQPSASWIEKLNRGLVAVPVNGGIYLSWRLQEDEDSLFGSGTENVSFDIYRNGEKIATESNTTNYIDADGKSTDAYYVTQSGTGLDGLKNTASFSGREITVSIADGTSVKNIKVYAAKYNASDKTLERVSVFDVEKTGESTFTADFDIDKVFLWDDMKPVENKAASSALMMSSDGYLTIPLEKPADETIIQPNGTVQATYSFFPADCSAGDVDGDGEYEIIIKWTSSERDVGSPGDPAYSGTVRFSAYKLDGTKLWDNDINLGKNVYSSAHTAQFLVYDFDGDGRAEIMVQTSLGSTDGKGNYVSHAADPENNAAIYNLTDEENAAADYRGGGRVCTGEEFLTVFNGATGEAIDTIDLPTSRGSANGVDYGDDFGNRSNRFVSDVAYLDGEKPYAVYLRGYYFGRNGKQRTSIAGISFDGERLSPDYRFDTKSGQPGYFDGAYQYVGQGNHNCTVADVDGDGKDEFLTGALCMEVKDDNSFKPKWCTYLQHGDALHIGNYDPTHDGLEFFTVHEESGENTLSGETITMDYGMSVIDAATGEIIFHVPNTKDTGRGVMANTGSGGYYQITGVGSYQCNGGTNFTPTDNGAGSNFRVFWDGDLYDELLDGTNVTSWNGRGMSNIFNAGDYGCVKINGTKSNPALQADLFGDWREELVYPTNDGNALRVFTTTAKTDYKIKSLMYDRVYRMGVAAEQTAYNQPPHIGFYLSDDLFYGTLNGIELDSSNAKKTYYLGEDFDKSGIKVTGKYSDAADRELGAYSVSGYDSMTVGEQTITIKYMMYSDTYTVNVVGESGITARISQDTYKVGEPLDKSGVSVKLVYADDTEKEIEGFKISGYDSLKAGEQILTVSYTGAGGTYTTDMTVNITTGLVIENGVVTGYIGEDEEIVIPLEYNGEAVAAIAAGALADSPALKKMYIYSEDTVINGENTFPAGVTIVCYEGSAAQTYADANGITTEIMTKGDAVTFDEDFYSAYAGKNMLMQSGSEASLKDEFITYNTHAADSRAPWYAADTYGFSLAEGADGNYLNVNAGIYDDMNKFNQVYITLNSPKAADGDASVSFDIMFPSGGNSPYVEIQNDAGTVIDTVSGLTADTWYRYELTCSSGAYARTIYDMSGNEVSSGNLNVTAGNTAVSYIAFKQGFVWGGSGAEGVVNIDNLLLN